MGAGNYLLAGVIAVFSGLDRTAFLQIMVSRPIVVGPLTGWLLGDPSTGLQVGLLVELLWLGRLPVGAAIPPDDTQVTVGATALAIGMGGELAGFPALASALLATLVAIPLGKVGQLFDRGARNWNEKLLQRSEEALAEKDWPAIERSHLSGLAHFALSSLATFVVIVGAGSIVLHYLAPLLLPLTAKGANWLRVVFPLVGVAAILATINVRRALTLFSASFVSAFLLLWLL